MQKPAISCISLLFAFCASSVLGVAPAMALEAKQCLPLVEMNAALKADGQKTLIIGDRIAAHGDTAHPGVVQIIRNFNAVTSNDSGTLGYQLEGDKSRTETSTTVCVSAKLTDIQLLDARRIAIPKAAYLGGDFDRTVDQIARGGNRPMIVANTLFGTGNSQHNGLPVILFGNMPERLATIATRTSDGKSQLLALMNRVEYTPEALRRLDQTETPAPRK